MNREQQDGDRSARVRVAFHHLGDWCVCPARAHARSGRRLATRREAAAVLDRSHVPA